MIDVIWFTSNFHIFFFFSLSFFFSGTGYTIKIISSCKISAPVLVYLSAIRLLIILLVFYFIYSVQMTGSSVSFSVVVCCIVDVLNLA